MADLGIDEEKIKEQAVKNLNGNKPYQKLRDEYVRLNPSRDFVKRSLVQTKMRQMESAEMDRLIALENKRRMDVNYIAELLRGMSTEDYQRYQELMSGLAFCIDLLDWTFTDINGILYRNGIGVQMEQFPEITAAKKMIGQLADKELNMMPEYKASEYEAEGDRLWKHLKERCAVYRRKSDRCEEKYINKK